MSIFRVALLTEQDGRQTHVHAAVLLHARTSAGLAKLTERIQTIRGRVMAAHEEDWTYEAVIDRLAQAGLCVSEVICLPEDEANTKSPYADRPPDQRAEEWWLIACPVVPMVEEIVNKRLLDKLTKRQRREFVRQGGVHCPLCRSDTLEVTDQDFSDGVFTAFTTCGDCGVELVEYYELTDVQIDTGSRSMVGEGA